MKAHRGSYNGGTFSFQLFILNKRLHKSRSMFHTNLGHFKAHKLRPFFHCLYGKSTNYCSRSTSCCSLNKSALRSGGYFNIAHSVIMYFCQFSKLLVNVVIILSTNQNRYPVDRSNLNEYMTTTFSFYQDKYHNADVHILFST